MIKSVVAALLLVPAIAIADPSPFGLEIGKATIKDVKQKYSAKSEGFSNISNGEVYSLDVSEISFEGLQSVLVVFSEDDRLLSVQCKLSQSKFNYLFDILKDKYLLIDANINDKSDKIYANFKDGDTEILLFTSRYDFQMDMSYSHKDFNREVRKYLKKEKQEKEKREVPQL